MVMKAAAAWWLKTVAGSLCAAGSTMSPGQAASAFSVYLFSPLLNEIFISVAFEGKAAISGSPRRWQYDMAGCSAPFLSSLLVCLVVCENTGVNGNSSVRESNAVADSASQLCGLVFSGGGWRGCLIEHSLSQTSVCDLT